jgi:hypothetical protein
VTARLKRSPRRLYVMGQRTKRGNCSAKQNLSFNWRLILTPEFVLRNCVTHEAVHLAVPDHSPKFWLAVQSTCPEAQAARRWLREVRVQSLVATGSGGFSIRCFFEVEAIPSSACRRPRFRTGDAENQSELQPHVGVSSSSKSGYQCIPTPLTISSRPMRSGRAIA